MGMRTSNELHYLHINTYTPVKLKAFFIFIMNSLKLLAFLGFCFISLHSRRIQEAGFKEDITEIGQKAVELGSKGLESGIQFLGKAFEKTSSHVETGLGHLESAGKTVASVGQEVGDVGKSLFASAKEMFGNSGLVRNDVRNVLNRAENQNFKDGEFDNEVREERSTNDGYPSFLEPIARIPWGGFGNGN